MTTLRTEVVVVGGGPAGAVAAHVLARAGRRVVLVEASADGSASRVGEALAPAARPILARLGLLDRVRRGDHLTCPGNVSVWGSETPRQHNFLRDPHGPGLHLDRAELDASLRAAAAESGARVVMESRVRSVERGNSGWCLELSTGGASRVSESLQCDWLIDATGRSSALSGRFGDRRRQDNLIAFVARWRPRAHSNPDRDARTFIEASEDGWWYSARLPGGERVVAFHTDSDLIDAGALRTARGFNEHLSKAPYLKALLITHGYVLSGRPRGADASSSRLDPVAGDGYVAVGDAAISLDPLSSQGLFNALFTGLRGAEAVDAALAGRPQSIEAYKRRLASIYTAFLDHRRQYYALEGRWSSHLFWQRRQPRWASLGAQELAWSGERAYRY
ncbi:MAG: tryptophan 7-halogenase [Acidobacteriota bacterium]